MQNAISAARFIILRNRDTKLRGQKKKDPNNREVHNRLRVFFAKPKHDSFPQPDRRDEPISVGRSKFRHDVDNRTRATRRFLSVNSQKNLTFAPKRNFSGSKCALLHFSYGNCMGWSVFASTRGIITIHYGYESRCMGRKWPNFAFICLQDRKSFITRIFV